MATLQELSDRFEIQQLMLDYATAIDTKNFDGLDKVFTADAYIDYRAMGGIDGRFPEVKAWLQNMLPQFPTYNHMISNVDIKLDGDRASSRIICFNPMAVDLADGSRHVMFYGLWYHDKFTRTPTGWRFTERVEEKCFDYNVPQQMPIA
jgi:hypothetical protein